MERNTRTRNEDQNYMERKKYFAKKPLHRSKRTTHEEMFRVALLSLDRETMIYGKYILCDFSLCHRVFPSSPATAPPLLFYSPITPPRPHFFSPDSWARTSTHADCCTPPPGITTAVGQWRRIRFRVHDDERRRRLTRTKDWHEDLGKYEGASGSEWAGESMSIGQTPRNIKNERRTIKVRIRS